MPFSEGQKLGALMVLILSAFYYGFSLFHARQSEMGTLRGKISPAPISWGRQEAGRAAIEVRGSRRDGIYFMPEGTTFDQISNAAGIPEGRSSLLSPKRVISDGALLSVSPAGEVTLGEMAVAARLALGLRIDLNRVSEGDLSLVPGIGERMAAQIIQLRLKMGAFRDLSDLTGVPGIKEKKLNSLRDYLMVRWAP